MEGVPSMENIQRQQAQKAEYEERRAMILDQILEPAAKERLTRLSMVKKDVVRAVEDSMIAGATSGKLQGKVTEAQLIAMLEQISGGASSGDSAAAAGKSKITVQRRKYKGMEEDDEDDDSDLL